MRRGRPIIVSGGNDEVDRVGGLIPQKLILGIAQFEPTDGIGQRGCPIGQHRRRLPGRPSGSSRIPLDGRLGPDRQVDWGAGHLQFGSWLHQLPHLAGEFLSADEHRPIEEIGRHLTIRGRVMGAPSIDDQQSGRSRG